MSHIRVVSFSTVFMFFIQFGMIRLYALFSFSKDSPMFSHHWKCYLQIDSQYYRKIAFHFVKKNILIERKCAAHISVGMEFRLCLSNYKSCWVQSMHTYKHTQYGIRYKLYRKPFNLKRFAEINEFGYFEGNSQKWLTTLCRRMWNMNSSVEFAGELVFVWFWIFVLFVYVSSVVSSFDRLFVRSYGVFHFGLGAWMKCARNIITENECIGLNLVPFVYVFALGWNNSTKQSSFLCLLCLRLHTSLVPHW